MWPWTVNQVLYLFCYQRVRYFLLPFTESKRRRKWQPWRRKWQPTLVLLPRKFHGWRSLVGYSPWGRKESDTTEWLFTFALLKVRLRPFAFQFLRKMKARIDFEIILILYLFSFRMLLYLLLKSSVVIRHSYLPWNLWIEKLTPSVVESILLRNNMKYANITHFELIWDILVMLGLYIWAVFLYFFIGIQLTYNNLASIYIMKWSPQIMETDNHLSPYKAIIILLIMVLMRYITTLWLIYYITRGLYLLILYTYFVHPPPPSLLATSCLFSVSAFLFFSFLFFLLCFRFYTWEIIWYLFGNFHSLSHRWLRR